MIGIRRLAEKREKLLELYLSGRADLFLFTACLASLAVLLDASLTAANLSRYAVSEANPVSACLMERGVYLSVNAAAASVLLLSSFIYVILLFIFAENRALIENVERIRHLSRLMFFALLSVLIVRSAGILSNIIMGGVVK